MNRRQCLRLAAAASLPGVGAFAWPDTLLTVISGDGLWRLTADLPRRQLLLHDAQSNMVRSHALPAPSELAQGAVLHTPLLLQTHVKRQSFVIAFGACSELWEISYNPQADDIFDGLVHDYRNHEGLARPGFLGLVRILLTEPLDDLLIDTESAHVLGRARWHQADVQVVNLDIRRVRARIRLPLANRLGLARFSACSKGRLLRVPTAAQAPDDLEICINTVDWQPMPCPDLATAQNVTCFSPQSFDAANLLF